MNLGASYGPPQVYAPQPIPGRGRRGYSPPPPVLVPGQPVYSPPPPVLAPGQPVYSPPLPVYGPELVYVPAPGGYTGTSVTPLPPYESIRRRQWRLRRDRFRKLKGRVVVKSATVRNRGYAPALGIPEVPPPPVPPAPGSSRREVRAIGRQSWLAVRKLAHVTAVVGSGRERVVVDPLQRGTTRTAARVLARHPVKSTRRLWRKVWAVPPASMAAA